MQERTSKSIQVLVLKDPTPTGAPQPAAPAVVTFQYCPFCGTRLIDNEDVLEWIERRMR